MSLKTCLCVMMTNIDTEEEVDACENLNDIEFSII